MLARVAQSLSPVPDNSFYIVGCQRSGTTLIRLVLECHSQIKCYDELASYRIFGGDRLRPPARRLLGFKVPCLTEQFVNPVLWDFLLLPEVPNRYRGERLIFLVRDVRDTVTSMLRLRVRDKRWVTSYCIPCLEAKMRKEETFRERYASIFDRLKKAKHPDAAAAALYWRYKVESLLTYQREFYPVLLVRYEDIVLRPEAELLRVCGFLQLPWEPSLLNHPRISHSELDRDGLAIGNTDPARAIDSRSVTSWREFLRRDELDEILEFTSDMQAMLYPDIALGEHPQ